jgi:hypothetical protein
VVSRPWLLLSGCLTKNHAEISFISLPWTTFVLKGIKLILEFLNFELWRIFVWTSATLKFDPENGGQICVKLGIITQEVARQIKNVFQRIQTYSSSFRMLKEFECTSYFKPTSFHPRKSVFSFAEQLMIRYKIQTKNSQKCNLPGV